MNGADFVSRTASIVYAPADKWCVWTKNGRRPKCFYSTREEAEAQAARLAVKVKGAKFCVLHMTGKFWLMEHGGMVSAITEQSDEPPQYDTQMEEPQG